MRANAYMASRCVLHISFTFFFQLEWIYWSDVRFLDRFIADQNQYLVISFKNGHKDHVQGPASLFLDPVVHKSISVEAAVRCSGERALLPVYYVVKSLANHFSSAPHLIR